MNDMKKVALTYVVGGVIGSIPRLIMKKKGMVKSFWYGLPKKPGTYK